VVETQLPSKVLTALSVVPLVPLLAAWALTEGFNTNPSLPPFFSKILPLLLSLVSAILALFAYNAARDEEPEWGGGLVFKLIEGLSLGYILLAAIFVAMILFTYFVKI
jgi:hypothetical protein